MSRLFSLTWNIGSPLAWVFSLALKRRMGCQVWALGPWLPDAVGWTRRVTPHSPPSLCFSCVYFNSFPFLSAHCFDPLCPLTVLGGPRWSHVKRQFLQGFFRQEDATLGHGGCQWLMAVVTEGHYPFVKTSSCQLPARTNVNQCVSFSTEINFFFLLQKELFRWG